MRWMRPVIVCLDPSGLIGKYMATKTPTPHIPKRIRPIRDRADCGIPLYNPINKHREAILMLRKAVVIMNPYGPTAYSLVGRLIGFRSGRKKCKVTITITK